MNFNEWWESKTEALIRPVPWAKEAWDAAIEEVEKVMNESYCRDGAFDTSCYEPDVMNKIRELKS